MTIEIFLKNGRSIVAHYVNVAKVVSPISDSSTEFKVNAICESSTAPFFIDVKEVAAIVRLSSPKDRFDADNGLTEADCE